MLPEPRTLAELQAWYRHPGTVARMAEVNRWAAEQRECEFEEVERALREEQEAEARCKQEQREAEEAARRLAEAVRQREERARFFGLTIRKVRYDRRGGHDLYRVDHRATRMVHGVASSPTITSNNHSRNSAGCKIEFPIPLLCEHEPNGSIGEVVSLRRSPKEIYVVCALHDDNLAADYAWSLVEQGELKAFSVASVPGTSTVAGSVLGTKFYSSWQLAEVSLCRRGANPDCRAEIFSSRRRLP